MATIGFSTESGAVHSVLWDTSRARVVEHDALPGVSDEWAETSLNTAVDDLSSEGYSIDAVGVVCAQDSERARIWALDGRPATVVPIAAALLEWMDASGHFTDQQHVLVYVVDDGQVRMSLVDRTGETLSDARVTAVDAKSAEKFGATVPVAWDVLDHADVEADSVALFADPSDEALLKPILELGLGKPVVRIDSYGTSIAHGAALVAARTEALAPAPVVPPEPAPVAAAPVAAETPIVVAAPVVANSSTGWMHSRRNLVLAGVLLLGVLSGGVALAATLPGSSTPEPAPVASVSGPVAGTAPSAETPNVPSVGRPVQVPAVAAPVPAPGPAPPLAVAPIAAPVEPAPVAAAPWTNTAPAAVAPPGATSAASAPAATVDPPVFEVPPIVPDPSKSQAELQQEAWDRHWQHTAEWLDQELALGQ